MKRRAGTVAVLAMVAGFVSLWQPDSSLGSHMPATVALTLPGGNGNATAGMGSGVANDLSGAFTLGAGTSTVTVTTTAWGAGNRGLWCNGGSYNVYTDGGVGTWTRTDVPAGVPCIVYSYPYSAGYTGAGTFTYDDGSPEPSPSPSPSPDPSPSPSPSPSASPDPDCGWTAEDPCYVEIVSPDELGDVARAALAPVGFVVGLLMAGVFVVTGLRR